MKVNLVNDEAKREKGTCEQRTALYLNESEFSPLA